MNKNNKKETKISYVSFGISLGVCFGVAFGIIFDNLAMYIGIGVSLGACFGAIKDKQLNKDTKK